MLRLGFVSIAAVVWASAVPCLAQMTGDEAAMLEESRTGTPMDEQEELERAGRGKDAADELSALRRRSDAVAEGRALYERGDYQVALERFLVARQTRPEDAEAALLLGLTHLRLDDPGKAAVAWNDYLKNAKDERLADDVRQYITILLHESNHREAQAALARESLLSTSMTDPRTVAVGPFRNLGSSEYAPLGKALAAMLIDNLQGIPDIQVLEREQVQALVEEADLAEKGLVEETTAVRAGKLLRAGTVAAGSHADFTASPTRLKVEAVLVNVDDGGSLATSTKEDQIERFYEIVPAIAADFAPVLTKKSVSELPPDQAERVTEDHTKSLPAAIAFGKALEAKDNKDAAEAQRRCREAENEDPDFRLARRVCGLIPPVWMSSQAVASAVEAQVMVAAAGLTGQSWVPWVAGGLVIAGAAAGGAVAASSGGGGGGGGQQVIEGGGNNAPGLQGVPQSASVRAGETLTYSITSNDPDGNRVTISVENAPAGSSLSQSSGALTNAQFTFRPSDAQAGQRFNVRFCATDDGNPPAQRCQSSDIRVLPRATPGPSPTMPPTCDVEGTSCNPSASQCCSGLDCGPSQQSEANECCIPLTGSCSNAATCCFESGVDGSIGCDGSCCITAGSFGCSNDNECCGNAICAGNECCLDDGEFCSASSECCPGLTCTFDSLAGGNTCQSTGTFAF